MTNLKLGGLIVAMASMVACGESAPTSTPGTGVILQAMIVVPAGGSVEIGGQVDFAAYGVYSNGQYIEMSVTWSSSDNTAASVEATGVATGFVASTVNIVAFDPVSGLSSYALLTTHPIPPPIITILTDELPQGTIGEYYSCLLAAEGGEGTPVWSIISGTLPAGLFLGENGLLSGTPEETGAFNIEVKVEAASYTTRQFTLVINDVPVGIDPIEDPIDGPIIIIGGGGEGGEGVIGVF